MVVLRMAADAHFSEADKDDFEFASIPAELRLDSCL